MPYWCALSTPLSNFEASSNYKDTTDIFYSSSESNIYIYIPSTPALEIKICFIWFMVYMVYRGFRVLPYSYCSYDDFQ